MRSASLLIFLLVGSTPLAHASTVGTTAFYLTDHLGSTRVVTDGSGAEQARYSYYPYGEIFSPHPLPSPQRGEGWGEGALSSLFTGQKFDSEINLYYYGARYYEPQLGRFISPDPARDGLNLYAYVGNNPIARNDPTGLYFKISTGNSKADAVIQNYITNILADSDHPFHAQIKELNLSEHRVVIQTIEQSADNGLQRMALSQMDQDGLGDFTLFRPINLTLAYLRTVEAIEVGDLDRPVLQLDQGQPEGIFFSSAALEKIASATNLDEREFAVGPALGSYVALMNLKGGKVNATDVLAGQPPLPSLIGTALLLNPGDLEGYLKNPREGNKQTLKKFGQPDRETGDLGVVERFRATASRSLQGLAKWDLIPDERSWPWE
ncbi:MAG: RHS repeat-associated core domain-containing protein [Deltaproteobacteria bacterium]|nr:RHS repeat-associated core domain-containing protein [Deltaproteobacteria bacterium]